MVPGIASTNGPARILLPLTLTLSPREREQLSATSGIAGGVGFVRSLVRVLPLHWGEGRGEGKGDMNGPHGVRFVWGTRRSPTQYGFEPFII